MATQVILTGTGGALEGQEFAVAGQDEVVIGRPSLCSLRRDEPTVSRRHCLRDLAGEWAWVRDLGSPHGTFVNGQDIGGNHRHAESGGPALGGFQRLRDGDELRLGDQAVRVGVSVTDPPEGQRRASRNCAWRPVEGPPGSPFDLARRVRRAVVAKGSTGPGRILAAHRPTPAGQPRRLGK
jgi:pSer/pThr/pTyr-binding forkhead associated (FHA) protein